MAEHLTSSQQNGPPPAGMEWHDSARTEQPLSGLHVVDLSTTPAGAICTMLLADQGASVLIVEPAGGHPLRRLPVARTWLRGKRSVHAASADPETLYAQADVVVLGSPDGMAPVLPAPDAARFPGLVICDVGGPAGSFSGDDDLVAAATGIMARQPGFRPGPVYVLPPLSTYSAAILAAQGIGAALYARTRDGAGDRLSVPLLHGSLAQQVAYLARTERPSPLQALRRNAYGQLPLYRLYQCRDGRWLHLGLINARFWPKLCVAIERPELISDPRFQAPVRFESHEARRALMDILAETFSRRDYAEWDALFDAHDVPCAPALTAGEFARDPQALDRRAVVTLTGRAGPERQAGLALHFATGPLEPAACAPAPGEHAAAPWPAVPAWSATMPPPPALPAPSTPPPPPGGAAYRELSPAPPVARHGPLAGVRILDASGYIAGPLGPALLTDLGADVIKIEGPDGDGLRGAHAGFVAWNHGKRGLCVDLRQAEGQAVVQRLAESADVFVDNMRPGVARRLGIDYETLSAINPRLIYCYVSAYGSGGPYRHKPGVDPLLQARSGIERAQGGHEHPPVFLLLAATDNTCAMLNAAGIALALYQREQTGRGAYFETSLLQAAALLQSDHLLDYPGRPAPFVNDYEQTGPGPLRRLYRTADGWIFLAAADLAGEVADERLQALAGALALRAASGGDVFLDAGTVAQRPHDAADVLAAALAALTSDEALHRLNAAGTPATDAAVSFSDQFVEQLRAIDGALIATRPHALLGAITAPGPLIRFDRNPGRAQWASPLLGEHSEQILAEAGFRQSAIARLIELGTVGTGVRR